MDFSSLLNSPWIVPVVFLAGTILLVILVRPRFGLYIMLAMAPLQNLLLLGNGVTVVRYVGMVVFVSWAMHKMTKRTSLRDLFASPVIPPMFVFLAVCLISALWTDFGLWLDDIVTYLQLGMWVLILIDLTESYEYLEKALFWLFAGALVGAILAVYEFFTASQSWQYNQRGRGGFDDPNYSSAIFMFVLPFVFYRIRYSNGLKRLAWLGSAVILLSGVSFTVSRTGLLAIALLVVGQFMKLSKARTRAKYVVLLIIFVLITIPIWPWNNISYRFSMAWTGGNDRDLGLRMGLLRYGWNQFLESPIIGHGLTNSPGQDIIHNLFLSIAVKLGILGFLVMFWLWMITWRSLSYAYAHVVRQSEEKLIDLISSVQLSALIYLFFSLSLMTELSRPQWFLFALGSICWELVQDEQAAQSDPTIRSRQPLPVRDNRW